MLAFWRYYDVVGQDFTNSVVYLGDDAGIPVAPVLNFFVGIMTGSTVLNVIMGVSFILWNVLLLFVIAMICTRNIFAWSFDGWRRGSSPRSASARTPRGWRRS